VFYVTLRQCSVEEKKMEVCGIIADIKRQGKGQSLSFVIM
jgi:hypothetical protein